MNVNDAGVVLEALFKRRLALVLFLFALPLTAETALMERGRAALDRQDPQSALDVLQHAVAENPTSADAHYLLGIAYGNLAERASVFRQPVLARHARDEFERAVKLDPNHLDARWSLVQYYTLAPRYLGGGEEKAREQARQIGRRDASFGRRASDFIMKRNE